MNDADEDNGPMGHPYKEFDHQDKMVAGITASILVIFMCAAIFIL